MSVSVYKGLYDREFLLTVSEPGGYLDPDTDLWVEGGAVERSVTVWFESDARPQIMQLVGANSVSESVRGRCLEPAFFPEQFLDGQEVAVTEVGAEKPPRKLTLSIPEPEAFSLETELEGQLFYGRLFG